MKKEYYVCDTRGCSNKSEFKIHQVTDIRKEPNEKIDLCNVCYDAYLLGTSIGMFSVEKDLDVATKNSVRLVNLLRSMPDDEWARIYGSQGLVIKNKLIKPEEE